MKKRIMTLAMSVFAMLMLLCTAMPVKAANATLVKKGNSYYYMVNGVNDKKFYGFVDFQGGKFLVANGKVATHIEGLAQDPKNPQDWYFLAAGQAQTQYTGLAQYDGAWFYVDEGILDTTMNAIVEYDGGLFLVAAGQIKTEVNGLVQDPEYPDWWYFVSAGQVQTQYTGLALYDGAWFYVAEGIFQNDFTGYVKYQGEVFYVNNGQLVSGNPYELQLYHTAVYNRQIYASQIAQIQRYLNEYRSKLGLPLFSLDEDLCIGANIRAQEVANAGYLTGLRHNGDSWSSIFDEMQIDCYWCGENRAYGYSSPYEFCYETYYSSNNGNILESDFTRIGAGLTYGADGTPYWVLLFAD